jgi:hypothetical protein
MDSPSFPATPLPDSLLESVVILAWSEDRSKTPLLSMPGWISLPSSWSFLRVFGFTQ